jgi:ssDNA-binding Zn-finger/Zn-ribbon topoisomerase 1
MFGKKEKPMTTYTVEQCASCKNEVKRKFKEGDRLFADGSACTKCKTTMSIAKIFGQAIE